MKKVAGCLLLAALCLSVPVLARDHKKHSEQEYQESRIRDQPAPPEKEPWLKVKMTVAEKGVLYRHADELVPQYSSSKHKRLPPGLAKKVARGKRLPPGWEKKLACGETFSPILYEHAIPVPEYIIRDLPPQPRGTILISVEGKIVRLYEATKTIIDVLDLKW